MSPKTLLVERAPWQAAVFPTELGWMALVGRDDVVARLTFGHAEAAAAAAVVRDEFSELLWPNATRWLLVARLTRFAKGQADEFSDIMLAAPGATPFTARVTAACRAIPIGHTKSYKDLAEAAGAPNAARAVGQVMARNRVALIVPCHRVLGSGGLLGGYSMGDGLALKRRLLDLELRMSAPRPRVSSATKRSTSSKRQGWSVSV